MKMTYENPKKLSLSKKFGEIGASLRKKIGEIEACHSERWQALQKAVGKIGASKFLPLVSERWEF